MVKKEYTREFIMLDKLIQLHILNPDGSTNIVASVNALLTEATIDRTSVPRNIMDISANLKLPVQTYNFTEIEKRLDVEEDYVLAGISALSDKITPVIMCRISSADAVLNFALAHELGHAVIHAQELMEGAFFLQIRNGHEVPVPITQQLPNGTIAAYGTAEQEVLAEMFAKELTMPEDILKNDYSDLGGKFDECANEIFIELLDKYNVTFRQLKFRLRELGLLKQWN